MSSQLTELWKIAAGDLGLDVQIPFSLELASGTRVEAHLLLRRFGNINGMLVITDFSAVAHVWREIVDAGYGFSTLSEPRKDDTYDREHFIEMLCDWSWTGPESERPEWCTPVEDDVDPERDES